MAQEVEIGRKTSILSFLSAKFEEDRKVAAVERNEKPPKDTFFLVHSCCFLLGVMNIVPMFFFNTATGYWMYKFRDPTQDSDSTIGADRTTLQSNYQSCSTVAQVMPSVIFSTLLTLYGHKVAAIKRTIGSLLSMIALFSTFILFTQINTDSWQTAFFIITISLLVLNSALTATIQMSTAVLIAKLPHDYMFCFLLGQNGSLVTTTLQIICLALTNFQPTAALIYFIAGVIIITLTFTLLVLSRQSRVFKYFDVEDIKDLKSETITWVEAKEVMKKIWPCQVLMVFMILNVSMLHPAITTLVVSEQEADNTPWATKYFTPLSCFMTSELGAVLGRITSKNLVLKHSNKWWYIIVAAVRLLVSVPICILFKAEPRNLPVIFHKDWEFVLFNFVFGFTMGGFMNVVFMSIKSLVGTKQEAALKLLTLTLTIIGTCTALNGILMVRVLLL